jgi:hypothetical protein
VKKFLSLLCLVLVCSSGLFAQWKAKTVFTNSNKKLSHFQSGTRFEVQDYSSKTVTTTDATPTNIDTVTVSNNEVGVLEVTVVGYYGTAPAGVTGKQIVRYKKVAGTLTLGTAADVLAVETDTALGAATFAIVASGNQIYIRVTGAAAKSVAWESHVTKQLKKT